MNDEMKIWCSVVIIVLICVAFCFMGGFSCWNKHIHGNKQFFDFKQNFNTAYIKIGDKVEKLTIEKWNDYEKSDTVQIVTPSGKVYYTHSVNVVLANE